MNRRTAGNKSGINRWARGIGRLAAETEMATMDVKTDFEAKIRRLRIRQQKILKTLAAQHLANQRALSEFRTGIRRASADLHEAYHSAIGEFRAGGSQKSKRVRARRKLGRAQ